MNIIEFIENPDLIGDNSLSSAQRMALKAVYGLPLDAQELKLFKQTTGLEEYSEGKEWEEVSFILGRRSGKSDKLASNIALYEACAREHHLSRGEIGVVMLVSSELRRQSRILYSYILHKLESSPVLRRLIKNITAEEISLNNGISIQIFPCNLARIRGQSLISFVGDEVSFWKVEGQDIDVDVLNAARPGLSFDHSKLIKISTPYMMKGEVYSDFKNYYGKPNDDVLVFRGSTELFNPTYSKRKLEKMKRRNPVAYHTEYEAKFRTDLSSMFDPQIIDRAVNYDRPLELAPRNDVSYGGFIDVAGGGGRDGYSVAVGHTEGSRVVIDFVRSRAPKFNPDSVTEQYCELLKQYGIHAVKGDKFSGDWASNSFSKHSIFYEKSEKTKSELYLECESPLNTGRVSIPNKESLITQLKSLIRKTRSGGKDSVDADIPEDEANVVAGVVWQLLSLQYDFTLAPSLGLVEDDDGTLEERLDKESTDWLLGKKKKEKNQDDDFDEDFWDVSKMDAIDTMRECDEIEGKKGKEPLVKFFKN